MDTKDAKIFVAGHKGLVGSAIVRNLTEQGYTNILVRSRDELDLEDASAVRSFFEHERPEYVFLAAAKVGGIYANATYPADFIRSNLAIELAVIDAAHKTDVKKLLFLGSSCIYPKFAEQPIRESALLTGALEETNRAYSIAKIAGIELCRAYRAQYGSSFISVMPTNLYGPNDSFDPLNSHVLPALMRRFHEAKETHASEVVVWGSGAARREFLHVEDLAAACVFLMNTYDSEDIINIGTGEDVSIRELAEQIKEIVGYEGAVTWDSSKPDGTPRKLLDVSKLHALGWNHTIALTDGISETYEWYTNHLNEV
jgi:GDP-L-fucose synthase